MSKLVKRITMGLMSLSILPLVISAQAPKGKREFYEIKVYHFKEAAQEKRLDNYLQQAFLPALHKSGIATVGVFKPVTNDTAADKRIYVIVPFSSLEQWEKLPAKLSANKTYQEAGKDYMNTEYNDPLYIRQETILLKAFPLAPKMQLPNLSTPLSEHIYELRSYEGPTEKLFRNKVQMFNEGGEIPLFKRLGFNAVFYSEVISGCHMPNLMYMTSFDNMAEREAHWKTFSNDPEWKKLSALPEYQHNVSHIDIILMKAAAYSDI